MNGSLGADLARITVGRPGAEKDEIKGGQPGQRPRQGVDVARVSDPAKAGSDSNTVRSTPMALAS